MPLPSETCVVYDTVTIQHFAAAGRLDLLKTLHGHRPDPRWVAAVAAEVQKGLNHADSKDLCELILAEPWFGIPGDGDAFETIDIQISMTEPGLLQRYPKKNLGEAEAIVYAKATGAVFVTDDAGAYDFASKPQQLGADHVLDACALLKQALIEQLIDELEFVRFHKAVGAARREMHCNCAI